MTRSELEDYAERLNASGLQFAARKTDGSGNVVKLQPIPWEAVIVSMVKNQGWSVVDYEDQPEPPEHSDTDVISLDEYRKARR